MLKPFTNIKGIPLRGGCNTKIHKSLLPAGSFSMIQDLRAKHPGFKKRPGQRKLHDTDDGTNQAMTLYQFRKSRIDEKHFYSQFSDGDVLESTNAPPAVATSAVFGTVTAHDGTSKASGMKPASWANLDDVLLYSNGVDQHQISGGDTNYISKVIKFDGSATPPTIPVDGTDYSTEATDGLTTTAVILDSLNTIAAFECVYICTPIPANKLTLTIGKPNGTGAVGTLKYRKSDGTWADTTETDGTISSGATLGQTGSMTWTHPSDEVPHFMYGMSGFWYQWETATQLDSEVEITKITYGSAFQDLRNVWDGAIPAAIEVQVGATAGYYETYGGTSVSLDELGSAKKIYIASSESLQGIYIDIGSVVDTNGTDMTSVKYWNGAAWTTVGTITDGTNGLGNSGWITFPRQTAVQPTQFGTGKYYAYWYELTSPAQTMPADMTVGIYTMPYFDIEELGKGVSNCAWKHRGCYSFTLWGEYIYVSASYLPQALNGDDFGILLAGDGRSNKVVAMRRFYNELMAWQEEKGVEGGCITLFQGYDPTHYGKLLLSSKVGTMNAKCVAVVDGVLTSTATDERIKTLGFCLSRSGVCATDGKTVSVISDDIQNYFDPTEPECIRRGHENEMWLEHDSAFNLLRIGLVSGASIQTATATSTSANKLADTEGAFTTKKTLSDHPISHTIAIGDTVYNTTDGTSALITAIDSATVLSLDTDIMVSGEGYEIYSATCNLFPTFDLTDKTWSFDNPAQSLSCMTEVESDAAFRIDSVTYDPAIVQAGGGVNDGFVYQLNVGKNDVSTAIDGYLTMELNAGGEFIQLNEAILRAKAVATSAGDITVTFTKNTISAGTKTLSMSPEIATQTIRRHRFPLNICDQNISVKLQNNTASKAMELLDMGLRMEIYEER